MNVPDDFFVRFTGLTKSPATQAAAFPRPFRHTDNKHPDAARSDPSKL